MKVKRGLVLVTLVFVVLTVGCSKPDAYSIPNSSGLRSEEIIEKISNKSAESGSGFRFNESMPDSNKTDLKEGKLTTEEAYRLIEETFKLDLSPEKPFPISKSLRYCDFPSDCTLVATDYCGHQAYGKCGYINSKFKQKWEEERKNWIEKVGSQGCFASASDVSDPKCLNNICEWEEHSHGC